MEGGLDGERGDIGFDPFNDKQANKQVGSLYENGLYLFGSTAIHDIRP